MVILYTVKIHDSRKSTITSALAGWLACIAIGAGGLGFEFLVDQIGHRPQRLATAVTFLCYQGAKPQRQAPLLVSRLDVGLSVSEYVDF